MTSPARFSVVIDDIPTTGGVHCETTALSVLLSKAGIALSEPMLFGLGSGLSFIYWDSKRQDFPFLGGRVKPFMLTENVCARLGLVLTVQETSSAQKAWDAVKPSIDRGVPVGLQLDSFDLEYFGSRVHFAGHFVAMYGYDHQQAYLVDTLQQGGGVTTSLASLARARGARGAMSARHRSFTVESPKQDPTTHEHLVPAIIQAVATCAEEFLAPPIANLGNRGILTTAKRIETWFERIEDPARDLPVIAMLMERAGTGGALFRNLYRDFLAESLLLIGGGEIAELVAKGKRLFAESALFWTQVADLIERAGTTGDAKNLSEASSLLERIAAVETDAMTTLGSLKLIENTR